MKEVIERVKHQVGNTAFPFVSSELFSIGMTLRDYFAASALQGIVACPETLGNSDEFARWSYELADAMLRARENT